MHGSVIRNVKSDGVFLGSTSAWALTAGFGVGAGVYFGIQALGSAWHICAEVNTSAACERMVHMAHV